MIKKIGNTTISLLRGDITLEKTDAIVNAANSSLAGGGGVDGAIHRAGGSTIMEECNSYDGCPTGSAVITGGGNLNARFIIHTVGPVYKGGNSGEAKLLKSAYKSSLKLAKENNVKSLAFPSISTGVYSYPIIDASKIALDTTINFIKENDCFEQVRFVLFSDNDLDIYKNYLKTKN